MKLYNPILGGKYIKELQMDIDKTIEVDDNKGKELLEEYPYLIDMDKDKRKPSYIDSGQNKLNKNLTLYQKVDKILEKLDKEPKKKNIWHTIKYKIRSL